MLVWFPNSSAHNRVRYSSICYPSNLRGIYAHARPDFLRMRVQIKMEPIDMKLKKCCILFMKTEHKRLCRLILNSDKEKFLQKHIGLFDVNGFICNNCKRQLRSIESKCAVIKSKCELAIKTVSGIDKMYITQNVDIKQVVDIKMITAKSVEIRNKTKSLSPTKRVCTPKRIIFFF